MTEKDQKVTGAHVKWLEEEAAVWQADGIIAEDQVRVILNRYRNIPRPEEQDQGSKLVTVLSIIGALLLGIGVILFFAANWQAMSKGLKLAVVFGSIVLAYGLGYFLAFGKGNYPRVGRATIFLGTILYGSGIWLVAQIFHISAHYPNGVLLWAIGIIPIIIVCNSLSVLLETSVLLVAWTVVEQTGFQTYNWLYLPLAALVLYLGYRIKSRLAVAIMLIGTTIWIAIANLVSVVDVEKPSFIFTFLLTTSVGLLFYALEYLHTKKDGLAEMKIAYRWVGILVTFVSLFILSFRFFIHEGMYINKGFAVSTFFLIGYIIISAGAAGGGIFAAIQGKLDKAALRKGTFILGILLVSVFLAVSARWLNEVSFTAVSNLLLFGAVIAIIVIGFSNKEVELINLGLIFFVLDVIARYFDFFWDTLPKSVFFMVGGILLLVGGTLLERNRRKIMREMKVTDYAA